MAAPVGAGIRDRLPAEVIRSPPEALGNAGLGAGPSAPAPTAHSLGPLGCGAAGRQRSKLKHTPALKPGF